MTDHLQPVTSGGPREADVSALSAELDALWRTAAEDSPAGHAVVRACALTLLVFTESEEAATKVSNLLSNLTLQNPCRALILVIRPEVSTPRMSARVSAVCQLPAPGEKQVCCEHVTIVAEGERVHDLDKVVVPLMVSGLPVCLWWRAGRITKLDLFAKILRYVDRVYVDSERFPNPESDLPTLAEIIRKSSRQAAITDLNWARVTPWRELAAGCFDSADTRPYLNHINDVRIEYRAETATVRHCLGQALLFAAWLGCRLGWGALGRVPNHKAMGEDSEGSDGRVFLFRGPEGEIRVQLDPRPGGPECSSGFLSIQLNASGASPASFKLDCGSDSRSVLTRIILPQHAPIEHTSTLEVFDEVGLLNQELKLSGKDRVYEDALAVVQSMIR